MKNKVFIENWTKVGKPDYRTEVTLQHIPRIGERMTFEDEDEDGNWEDKYYVIDVIHQIKGDTQSIFILISDNLENVSNFYYSTNEMILEIHHATTKVNQ
ncbi:MAG: hypothetical protein RI922_1004 [Bacteroidota bacterium]|jgi:hypothetical protein